MSRHGANVKRGLKYRDMMGRPRDHNIIPRELANAEINSVTREFIPHTTRAIEGEPTYSELKLNSKAVSPMDVKMESLP
jgi:hypothetical protein